MSLLVPSPLRETPGSELYLALFIHRISASSSSACFSLDSGSFPFASPPPESPPSLPERPQLNTLTPGSSVHSILHSHLKAQANVTYRVLNTVHNFCFSFCFAVLF